MKFRNCMLNSTLLTCSLLLTFLVLEIVSYFYLGPRSVNQESLYKDLNQFPLGSHKNTGSQSILRENIHILVSNAPTSTNNFGLRGVQDRSLTKSESVLRIAVFGDSFTFGFGVHDDETFPYQIERLLNDRLSKKCKVEVLNFGIPGFNTLEEFMYFSKFGMTFFPDVVLFQWFANDFETNGYQLTDLDTIKKGHLLDPLDRPQSPKSDFGSLTQALTWLKRNSDLYEMAAPRVKNLLFNYTGIHIDAIKEARLSLAPSVSKFV